MKVKNFTPVILFNSAIKLETFLIRSNFNSKNDIHKLLFDLLLVELLFESYRTRRSFIKIDEIKVWSRRKLGLYSRMYGF